MSPIDIVVLAAGGLIGVLIAFLIFNHIRKLSR